MDGNSFFENSIDAMLVIRDGEFVECNDAAVAMLGYDCREEVLHRHPANFSPEFQPDGRASKEKVEEMLRQAVELGSHRFEWIHLHKDGTEFPVEVSLVAVPQDGGVVLHTIWRDISEHKQAEETLRESEERFRSIFDATNDALFIQDFETGETLDVNRKMCELYGVSREEALSHGVETFSSNVPPYTRKEAYEWIRKAAAGEPQLFEWRAKKKGGELFWVEVNMRRALVGSVERLIVSVRDITERKRIEKDRERFVAAINQAAETIVITDSEGLIEYVNPAFERITGYACEEAMGQNPRVLKSGEHDKDFYRAMWDTILGGETWHGVFVNQKKDGSTYTEEASISPVKDASGKIVNFVAIKMDITNELAREEQYRQTQKMESVGRLASGVAHDFNNILQTITGFCGLILSEMDITSPHRKDVLEIQAAVKHAGDLTRQLLSFSRKRSAVYHIIDLNVVLSKGSKMLRQALGKGFQLRLQLASALYSVRADSVQILQIAMNLVVNARDAMLGGGEILLTTQNVEILEDRPAHMPSARKGVFVCLSVADTGCGMDERQRGYIFDPFFTTKQPGEGTGLGLSVVYGIVKEYGGWIHVESELGKGSVFKVYFPMYNPKILDATPPNGEGASGLLPKKILLVEDEPMVQELTCEILQNVGYAVCVAKSIEETKALFAAENGSFDLLFCNAILPDGSGLELANYLLKQQPRLPVLLFGNCSDECVRADLIREKGFGYMRKPFNLKSLLDVVALTIADRK
jgi:PAS domain S-box-containing protein